MIRWLRYKLERAWYWRHLVVTIRYSLFTGRGEFWCGRCGGTVHAQEIGRDRLVMHSTCPVGRAVQRYQVRERP